MHMHRVLHNSPSFPCSLLGKINYPSLFYSVHDACIVRFDIFLTRLVLFSIIRHESEFLTCIAEKEKIAFILIIYEQTYLLRE